MALRRTLLFVASIALAIVLIGVLIKTGGVNLHETFRQLRSVSLISFAKVVSLNALLVYVSTQKWRIIDAAWRHPSDSVPSRANAWALTSIGLAMGIFLPVQLAMATARTLGTRVHGRPLKRGTAGTLLEQGFDVFTVGFLAVASGVTWFYHGGEKTWALCASAAIVLALLAVEPAVRMIRWVAAFCNTPTGGPHNRILHRVWALQHSGILNAGLARRLVVLSALRFGTIVLTSIATAEAVGLHIPVWQMAAAIPFVIIASVIAVTPGGIGLNELAYAGTLEVFGTPLAIGAQWALANRILVAVSYLFVATCGAGLLVVCKVSTLGTRRSLGDRV